MPDVQELSPIAATTETLGISKEDWLIIDEALHRVARSLRKIAKEEQMESLKVAEEQLPVTQ